MLIVLPFAHFFCAIVYIYLAVIILNKDSKILLNRASSAIMICFALWNFGDIFIHFPDSKLTKETVQLLQNISSFGWIYFISAILCFSVAFSKREKLMKKKWFPVILYILPLPFIYMQWTNYLLIDPIRQPYGWSFSFPNSIYPHLYYIYYFVIILISIYFIFAYGRETKNPLEKKQAEIITSTILASLIIGTIVDVIFPLFDIDSIPSIADLFIFIFAIGFYYAIVKYQFLTITPAIAAENIISSMDELLILLNQEGNILSVNKATLDSLQYDQNELEGQPIKKLLQEDDYKEILIEKTTEEVVIKNNDGHLLTKNGKTIPIIYSSSPLRDENENVIGTVFIARDITEHERNRVELIKAKEKAEESDRLKSAFLANMSHEIRTPMNGILGFAGLLKEPNLTGEEQQEFISVIEKSGARMLNIINDIISISKVEAGQMEVTISETDINEQIDYIDTFFKPEALKKRILLLCKKPLTGNDAIIKTDREKVYAILTNLVKNALKFTQVGTIEFGYSIVRDKASIRDNEACKDKVSCLVSTHEELEFFVKDTGLGVRNKQKEFIFERFRQGSESLSRNYEGAGLGLSISKAYVEMLGGQIWVESEEGKGSTFYFTLPYIQKSKRKIASDREIISDAKEIQMNKIRILVAEDDEASEKLITATIKKFSKEILKVTTGNDAVEACRNNPDIDLVLMDIKMPVMDGYEATRQIRQFNTKVIIIAQSAYALLGDREKAIDAGCNDYITKPMKQTALIELIRKYFDKHEL